MDKSDIRELRRWQVAAAKRARAAGFDIVYVYAGHGYLPFQFISHRANQRGDEYGGSLERYESAFYEPLLSDWRNFETWREAGALDGTRRANAIWKELLKNYEQPPLDPAIREELEAYVRRRKQEIAP